MVINNFYFFSTGISPKKAYPPLVVDADAMLTRTITLKRFKMITGWYSQVIKSTSNFKLSKFTPCNFGNIYKLLDTMAF